MRAAPATPEWLHRVAPVVSMRKKLTPARLVAGVVLVGAAALGLVVIFAGSLDPWSARVVLGASIAAWLLAIGVSVTVAVVAQAAARKRHGVFSHLRQSTTAEVMGDDTNAKRQA
jgi:hypothetical protein